MVLHLQRLVFRYYNINFKIATIYSYSNDCSPSRQFYTNLNILQNHYMCNKRIVSGKKFIAIASVVFPVGVINNQNKN